MWVQSGWVLEKAAGGQGALFWKERSFLTMGQEGSKAGAKAVKAEGDPQQEELFPAEEVPAPQKRKRGRPKKGGPQKEDKVVQPSQRKKGDPKLPNAGNKPISVNKPLSDRMLKFIQAYLALGEGKAAAIRAGYEPKNAAWMAHKLLRHPAVLREINLVRDKARVKFGYSLEAAMQEAQETMDFARETGNANAMAKAVELRSKLHGLLIERHNVHQAGQFQINILPFGQSTPLPIEAKTIEALPSGEPSGTKKEDVDR